MNLKKYEYEVKKKFVTNTLKKFGVVSCELLPINLNGVFNKCAYLLDIPVQDIKDYAKQERMIDIHYIPRVKYTKSGINSKMDWHINLILVSTIVNFCNTQDILMHFKPDYPIAELTNEDVKTNLVYWTSKLNEHATKYINDYFSHFNVANPEELLHDKIKQYSRYYKDLDEITRLIDLYSPMVNCQVHQFIKLDHINYGEENEQFKKCGVNIRVYGGERNETIKSVRTLDGSKCLYLPLDIKMQLFSWYNKDSKSCRKYLKEISKDIFPNKKKEECSIFNLYKVMTVFNKRNPDRILNLDDKQIETLKEDLKTIFSYYKDSYEYAPVIKNDAMENVYIREDVVVKEEEIAIQNVSKDEGDMFKFETEEDECVPNGDKLSNDDFFKQLMESV